MTRKFTGDQILIATHNAGKLEEMQLRGEKDDLLKEQEELEQLLGSPARQRTRLKRELLYRQTICHCRTLRNLWSFDGAIGLQFSGNINSP